ncbi:glycine--tRNA ligase subunit beta [Candidatus Schneideria nysicola]|uniref:glycine--tRNA ligase subunit beta n=1 Tax=Candidatus Schneideria nysicola TaxID=1081631 RepID=UPI001CAA6950|nr:glycine--tRNA ligase subunit beta [Candidatus Schneideria nysicola]UAJ65697.1 glycine--tRNA ligase subunit beta [Candidatus Schneideria nysicola]
MNKYTFLIEIGTEELPPKLAYSLSKDFANHLSIALTDYRIGYEKIHYFSTPRRLALQVSNLNEKQEDIYLEKISPRLSNLKFNPSIIKWGRNLGLTIDQLHQLPTNNGKLIYKFLSKGQLVKFLLLDIVKNTIKKLSISKSMRWGMGNIKFIRPVHTITLLLDNQIIPGTILGIPSDRILQGHRFIGKENIILDHANNYIPLLFKEGKVIADHTHRKNIILDEIEIQVKKIGGMVNITDEDFIDEITSLVEWPVVLLGHFHKKFLKIPVEVLIFIMKNEKKYFPIYNKNGTLLPYFILVSNIKSLNPEQVISGNEKTLHYRLIDTEFFIKKDTNQRLEEYLLKLNNIIFHENLGSLYEKSIRIKHLSVWIGKKIHANIQETKRAGLLSKCDLVTHMVTEFPSMQGIIGMHYAIQDGESYSIALAQKEQYYPRFFNDILPTTLISSAVSLADKIDNIVGILGIYKNPRGESDPFAIRRAAIGVLRIIIEKGLLLDLESMIKKTVSLYKTKLINTNVTDETVNFILNRFFNLYPKGEHNIIKAVLACHTSYILPFHFNAKIQAIQFFIRKKEFTVILIVYKRIANILNKSHNILNTDFSFSLLQEKYEIELANALITLQEKLPFYFKNAQYKELLQQIISMQDVIESFFKSVFIFTEDKMIQNNRLTLLKKLHTILLQIADISLLL